jgi:succinylglutamate desuccinylase
VRVPDDGLLLMPRYQGQGDDGFFLGREVRAFWLRLSAWLRRLPLERVLPLLPGVRRDVRAHRTLLVRPSVARWLTFEVFHLLGYRWARRDAAELVFVRRPDVYGRPPGEGRAS